LKSRAFYGSAWEPYDFQVFRGWPESSALVQLTRANNGLAQATLDGFYAENFIDMMGNGLASELRRPRYM